MAALCYTGVSSRRYDSMDPQKQLRPEQHYSVHSHIGTSIEIFGYLEHVQYRLTYMQGYIGLTTNASKIITTSCVIYHKPVVTDTITQLHQQPTEAKFQIG